MIWVNSAWPTDVWVDEARYSNVAVVRSNSLSMDTATAAAQFQDGRSKYGYTVSVDDLVTDAPAPKKKRFGIMRDRSQKPRNRAERRKAEHERKRYVISD